MSEVYPDDGDLNDLLSEAETGVEYIPTGTAPYYLHFRKLIYRLLLATKRANDLRVYDEGGLNIGVKAGKFWNGQSLVSYAGAIGKVLADNKANIYVYLNASGDLVYSEYMAFPDMAASKHVRLAVITTLGGDITAITDARDHHSIAVPDKTSVLIESHTGDDALTAGESGSYHSNLGASSVVTLTLPSNPDPGLKFTFAVQAAFEFRIDPGVSVIRDDSGTTADKYKTCATVGACITLVSDEVGHWATVGKYGTWTEEA